MDLQFLNAINRIVQQYADGNNITKFGQPLGRNMDQETDMTLAFGLFIDKYYKTQTLAP